VFTRLRYCLFGFSCRVVEDAVAAKIQWFQRGNASAFDYALLANIHQRVLARLKTISAPPGERLSVTTEIIGLHNSRVAMQPFNPAWSGMFETEATRLREQLGPGVRQIHHIGSTSIPGLQAKPIIDMAVECDPGRLADQLPAFIGQMERAGYRYLGNWKRRGGHFFEKGIGPVRVYAVQAHPVDGIDLRGLLQFRELMRNDPRLLREYSEIKTFLAETLQRQRGLYFWYKSHWVSDLMLEERGERAWGTWWISARYPTMFRFARRSLVRFLTGGRRGSHPMSA
jgi:GrpB-like predicted nucleotidyltransferase (UPF0157 family)